VNLFFISKRTKESIATSKIDYRSEDGPHDHSIGQGTVLYKEPTDCYQEYLSRKTSGKTKVLLLVVVRALPGKYMKGSSDLTRDPLTPGSTKVFYDSAVDDEANPKKYVFFKNNGLYPEFFGELKLPALQLET
jgi:hypothetical protein